MGEQRNGESLLGALRVLDLTSEVGLLCGKVLGDLGADVIKVEHPQRTQKALAVPLLAH